MLTVENVSKRFNNHFVVNDINFHLNKGQCTALLGPNGAGKTTTLRMLTGLIKPTSGKISYGDNCEDFRQLIGYLPQYPKFHDWMTGEEFLVYCCKLHGLSKSESKKRVGNLLERVSLQDAKRRRIGSYSGGMKQRLGLAQALIHEPKMLFLDEPVASLDPIGRREVLTLMEEMKEEMTILFSTHILNDAEEVSDSLILLRDGKVIEQGAIDALQEKYLTGKIELIIDYLDEAIIQELKQLPSVNEVNEFKNELHVFVDDVSKAQEELLTFILKEELTLQKFNIAKITLEEMFMKAVEK